MAQPAARTSPASIATMIDALLSYAIDPVQWERLASELDVHSATLAAIDPKEFLMSLSHAESLAWQMKSEADGVAQPSYVYVMLSSTGQVIAHSDNLEGLHQYIQVKGNKLELADGSSEAELQAAFRQVKKQQQGHLLVELRAPELAHRYGYLVARQNFPPALRIAGGDAVCALMIAQDEPTEKLRRVVQASFGLTSAEANVALKLASGTRLKDAATELSISVNTARNHLQAVFDKSGIKRQSDLLLVITQLSVILAATNAPTPGDTGSARISDGEYPPYEFLILPDGRRLAYRCYGTGNHKVVYLHETVGSSRLPPGTTAAADALDLCIVAPERPGTGFSDPLQGYSYASVARDLVLLLDYVGADKVILLGFLAGAAHALYTAAELPERVRGVMTVAGRAPGSYAASGSATALPMLRQRLLEQPWLLNTFFNILRNRASLEMNKRLLIRVYGAVPNDAALLEHSPWLLPHLAGYTMESLAVSAAGVVSELKCFTNISEPSTTGPPGASDSGPILAPVTMWHGTADVVASVEPLRSFLAGSNVTERLFPDAGSLILFEHWNEVLQELHNIAGR